MFKNWQNTWKFSSVKWTHFLGGILQNLRPYVQRWQTCNKVKCTSRQCSGTGSTGSKCFWASRIRILLASSKNSKKNLDFYCFVTSFGLLSLKHDVMYRYLQKVISRKTLLTKNSFLSASWMSMTKIARSGFESGSGSTPKCHGSGTLRHAKTSFYRVNLDLSNPCKKTVPLYFRGKKGIVVQNSCRKEKNKLCSTCAASWHRPWRGQTCGPPWWPAACAAPYLPWTSWPSA